MKGDKPPYQVPSMQDIAALPWNGFNAVSTFSGCGGSCLGYRLAGFKVLWASEFIPEAQMTYRANHPNSILDTRDIRMVEPEEILSATGLKHGELDLLDGSPPCASFSTAGKRAAGWGKVKAYSDKAQRSDDLFFEYVRILKGLQPKVFVAENVSGLIKGVAKGYFLDILKAMKECGYNVEAKVLDAQWLGVPQARARLIFQGVRQDLNLNPCFPSPLPYRYSVRDALPHIGNGGAVIIGNPDHAKKPGSGWARGEKRSLDLPSLTVQASSENIGGSPSELECFPPGDRVIHDTSCNRSIGDVTERPAPTVTVGINGMNSGHYRVEPGRRKFTIAELRRICGFPDDFILTGTYAQQWERCGRAVPPVMMSHVASAVRDGVLRKI